MESLIIWFIIIAAAIYKSKKKKAANEVGRADRKQPVYQTNSQPRPSYTPNQVQNQMQRNQSELKNRLQKKYGQPQPVQQAPQKDIISRAVANTEAYEVDELEQNKSVPVTDVAADVHTMIGVVDLAKSSELMNQVNDLIVMGYDPKLSFERDFVAEGIDMLNGYELSGIETL